MSQVCGFWSKVRGFWSQVFKTYNFYNESCLLFMCFCNQVRCFWNHVKGFWNQVRAFWSQVFRHTEHPESETRAIFSVYPLLFCLLEACSWELLFPIVQHINYLFEATPHAALIRRRISRHDCPSPPHACEHGAAAILLGEGSHQDISMRSLSFRIATAYGDGCKESSRAM